MKTTTNYHAVDSSNEFPQAWIAIKRNRQKIYTGQGKTQVYLKDGQEFQIELFNPTQIRYLVKIKINGNYQSDRGLILNPGQRYFLDRFIDEDKKLTFSTYDVESTEETKKAIEKNGLLEVEFYSEMTFTIQPNPAWSGTTISGSWLNLNRSATTGNPISFGGTTVTNLSTTNSVFTNSSISGQASSYSYLVGDDSIETGRVEKGERSDQSFENGSGSFNSWASHTTTVQIIPLSQQPAETQEIRSYCTGCGSRTKKQTWKFCPNCGTKID